MANSTESTRGLLDNVLMFKDRFDQAAAQYTHVQDFGYNYPDSRMAQAERNKREALQAFDTAFAEYLQAHLVNMRLLKEGEQ